MTSARKNGLSFLRPGAGRFGKAAMLAVVIVSFLIGYNSTVSNYGTCAAQSTIQDADDASISGGSCSESQCTPAPTTVVLCIIKGLPKTWTNSIYERFKDKIEDVAIAIEDTFYDSTDYITRSMLERINETEMNAIAWWDTFWYYNLRPAMQGVTEQINTSIADQTKNTILAKDAKHNSSGGGDVNGGNGTVGHQREELKDRRRFEVDDRGCPVATASGGLGRTAAMSKAMRQGLQNDTIAATSNKVGDPGAKGKSSWLRDKSETYEKTFCDPADNGGANVCDHADPAFYDADVQVTKRIYNKLTIPVTDSATGKANTASVKALMENLTVSAAADPIPSATMAVPQGHETWLQRRSFMARLAASRAAPQLTTGWRMSGAGPDMGKWIKELRGEDESGIPILPDTELSDDPSYKEILHAVSVDRFNSATYANSLITHQDAVEMEKLTLNTFYLMQLRDYFELLERTALTLAVQVSLMADEEQRKLVLSNKDVPQ